MWLYLEDAAGDKEKLLFTGFVLDPDGARFELCNKRGMTWCNTQLNRDSAGEYHLHLARVDFLMGTNDVAAYGFGHNFLPDFPTHNLELDILPIARRVKEMRCDAYSLLREHRISERNTVIGEIVISRRLLSLPAPLLWPQLLQYRQPCRTPAPEGGRIHPPGCL